MYAGGTKGSRRERWLILRRRNQDLIEYLDRVINVVVLNNIEDLLELDQARLLGRQKQWSATVW